MKPRDLRRYARQTNVQLTIGALLLLFIIGDGLIYLFYGQASALLGLLCLGIGLVPVLLIFFFFVLIDWIVKRANEE